jgi:hypothetical protein
VVFNEDHRVQVQAAMNELGVPSTYYEVEWSNRGHREAKDITVDVTCPSPIAAWNMKPASTDVAAAWRCTHDPSDKEADPQRLRLEQPRLRPQGTCKLLFGYNPEPGMPSPRIRAYSETKRLRFAGSERTRDATIAALGAFFGWVALVSALTTLPLRISEEVATLILVFSTAAAWGFYHVVLMFLEFIDPPP